MTTKARPIAFCKECDKRAVPKVVWVGEGNWFKLLCSNCGEFICEAHATQDLIELYNEQRHAADSPSGNFIRATMDFKALCHIRSKEAGFWDKPEDANPLVKMALLHTEVSEVVEAIRKPGESEHIPGFTTEEEEAADILIRLYDYAGARDIRLAEAVLAKLEFNLSRGYRHGNKEY